MALLDTILRVLSEAQRGAIKDLLARMKTTRQIRTPREELKASEELKSLINESGKVFTPKLAKGRISSEDHNSNMAQIFVDLFSLYTELDVLGKAATAQNATLDSEYLKSIAAVRRLITDARTFALRKQYKEYTEVFIIDFASAKNFSTAKPKALVSTKTQRLTLPAISVNRAHLPNRNEHVTTVYTNTVSPGDRFEKDLDPMGMVDQKPETFWATLIMTDVPVTQEYLTSGDKKITVNGPVVEIYVSFSGLERLNVVRVLPFGNIPISVIDVAYRPSKSSKVFRSLPLTNTEPSLNWIEVSFPPIHAAEIRISVAQESPRQSLLTLPRSLVVNTDIFQHVVRERARQLIGNVFFDSDLRREIAASESLLEGARADLEKLLNFKGPQVSDTDLKATQAILEALNGVYDLIQDSDDLIDVSKYEYLVGIRDIETSYEVYAPEAHFESELYQPQATLSEVSIEVDSSRIPRKNSWGEYFDTSVEWTLDLGEGRLIPIHPINETGKFSTPTVQGELLQFSRIDKKANTRLGADTNNVLALKQDGNILPKTGYTVVRNVATIPTLTITLNDDYWDPNSLYTVDYEVSPESTRVDVLEHLSPRMLSDPEVHPESGPDNDIILKRYPYVRYEIINRTGNFTKATGEAKWTYTPPEPVLFSGQVLITPTVLDSVNSVITSGEITGYLVTGRWGDHSGESPIDASTLTSAYLAGTDGFGYYTQFQDVRRNSRLTGTLSTTGLIFTSPPEFTIAEIKEFPSGATTGFDFVQNTGYLTLDYNLGVGFEVGDRIFVFDDSVYEPLKVTVAGRAAKNITDYEKLEHPAFSISTDRDKEYEFIHAGRRLYFNQALPGEAKVTYEWVTEHLKVLGTLRCNKAISPDSTPVVEEIRVLMNTSVL
ncbi:MAG: hypothetical protein D6698_08985 [Gammaproteobacteria bacterium]|nr:MAG: hypothetical protein D6698_08985 [Gammaproteobacteria bacterium]